MNFLFHKENHFVHWARKISLQILWFKTAEAYSRDVGQIFAILIG